MKYVKKKYIAIAVLLFIGSAFSFNFIQIREPENNSGIPDAVSSICSMHHEYLTVVANTTEVRDREKLAKQVVRMYLENEFYSIKRSEENGYPCSMSVNVYLHREDIRSGEKLFEVAVQPDDFNAGYNINDDPEHYKLIIDGQLEKPFL